MCKKKSIFGNFRTAKVITNLVSLVAIFWQPPANFYFRKFAQIWRTRVGAQCPKIRKKCNLGEVALFATKRVKSTFFAIFWTEWPRSLKKFFKNLYFSLWGNRATTITDNFYWTIFPFLVLAVGKKRKTNMYCPKNKFVIFETICATLVLTYLPPKTELISELVHRLSQ